MAINKDRDNNKHCSGCGDPGALCIAVGMRQMFGEAVW